MSISFRIPESVEANEGRAMEEEEEEEDEEEEGDEFEGRRRLRRG